AHCIGFVGRVGNPSSDQRAKAASSRRATKPLQELTAKESKPMLPAAPQRLAPRQRFALWHRRKMPFCRPFLEELETRRTPSTSIANIAVTTDPGVQQMPSVAVDPADPNHVVIAYMDYSLRTTGYSGIGVRVSHDGGNTWQQSTTNIPLPPDF